MKNYPSIFSRLSVTLLLLCLYILPAAAADQRPQEILITVHSDAGSQPAPVFGNPNSYRHQKRGKYGLQLKDELLIDKIALRYDLQRVKGWPIKPLGVYCEVLTVPSGSDLNSLLDSMSQDADIESVQLLNEFSVQSGDHFYNDPYFSLQYNLTDLNVVASHSYTQGEGVKIAVIDSKIDSSHRELRGSIDDSQDFVIDSRRASPEKHGTAVAGLIAAKGNNELGIVGVAPGASILGLRACAHRNSNNTATCNTFTLAQALTHAIERQVKIINLSLSGPDDPLLARLIKKARQNGIVVVAAAGDNVTSPNFPASMSEVIAVQAAGRYDPRSVIFAPGKDLLTTTPDDGFEFVTGSSFAAAQVTGLVALLLQAVPEMQPDEAKVMLLKASRHGQLDACSLLYSMQPSICSNGTSGPMQVSR